MSLPVRVHATPAGLDGVDLRDRVAVAIDVLRATSSMTTALHEGAAAIWPVAEPDDARALVRRRGWARDRYLLGGERGSVRIPGFDLGNSPAEYVAAAVAGREIVVTTTNGTRAIRACEAARRTFVASFLNAAATAAAAAEAARAGAAGLELVCAGTRGRFDLCDAACAGALLHAWLDGRVASPAAAGGVVPPLALDDLALACLEVFRANRRDIPGLFRRTAHGSDLLRLGMGADLELCGALDSRPIPLEFRAGAVRAAV